MSLTVPPAHRRGTQITWPSSTRDGPRRPRRPRTRRSRVHDRDPGSVPGERLALCRERGHPPAATSRRRPAALPAMERYSSKAQPFFPSKVTGTNPVFGAARHVDPQPSGITVTTMSSSVLGPARRLSPSTETIASRRPRSGRPRTRPRLRPRSGTADRKRARGRRAAARKALHALPRAANMPPLPTPTKPRPIGPIWVTGEGLGIASDHARGGIRRIAPNARPSRGPRRPTKSLKCSAHARFSRASSSCSSRRRVASRQTKHPQGQVDVVTPLAAAFREEAGAAIRRRRSISFRALEGAKSPDNVDSVSVAQAALDALIHHDVAASPSRRRRARSSPSARPRSPTSTRGSRRSRTALKVRSCARSSRIMRGRRQCGDAFARGHASGRHMTIARARPQSSVRWPG